MNDYDDEHSDNSDDDLRVLGDLWPRIRAEQDQCLARCRQWIEDARDGQIPGMWITLNDDTLRSLREQLDDDTLHILRHMALIGLCAAVESVIGDEDEADENHD
jgi:hypothetical protein